MNSMNKFEDLPTRNYCDGLKSAEWNFISAPNLHPMKVKVNLDKPGTSEGLLFVAPYTVFGSKMIGQTGALIMDQTGDPIWFNPLCSIYIQNTDFRVQRYKGQPVLTMWQGTISGTQSMFLNLPAGDPEPGAYYIILDQHYNVLKRISARMGFTSDLHEFIITKRNTVLFTAIKQVPYDLSPYGGPKHGFIDDYSIQEIDLSTGELVFFWNALSHINPGDSMMPAASATQTNNIWDCYHMNSIDEGKDGTLLVSMRNMWAIYKIAKRTGRISWQLGGKKSDFQIEEGADFSWQHDARYRSNQLISMFDDACCASPNSPPQCRSHGLVLELDYRNMSAKALRKYFHDPVLYVASQGNVQKQPNGNQFIGWGQQPYLSEYAQEGNNIKEPRVNFLYDMRYPNKNMSYRAFKNKWIGLPLYPPAIAAVPGQDSVDIYASWNGSTETVSWQVSAGSFPYCLFVKDTVARTGFETKITVKGIEDYYQVCALDSSGDIIGISEILSVKH